jgi:hypothetical protein
LAVTGDETEDAPVEALSGSVAGSGGADELSGLLLELTVAAVKAAVLLSEADEDDWRAVSGRLNSFLSVVEGLPTSPRPRRRVGFTYRGKNKKRRKT